MENQIVLTLTILLIVIGILTAITWEQLNQTDKKIETLETQTKTAIQNYATDINTLNQNQKTLETMFNTMLCQQQIDYQQFTYTIQDLQNNNNLQSTNIPETLTQNDKNELSNKFKCTFLPENLRKTNILNKQG